MTLLVLFLLIAVALALFLPGLGVLAIVPLIAALAYGGWVLLAYFGKVTPERAVRRTHKPELLGPGGPDDPDRGR